MLVVHALMIVLAVTSGLSVLHWTVAVFNAGRGERRQLQARALPPSRGADDKRNGNSQNQNMAKNVTHRIMLSGSATGRQRICWPRHQIAIAVAS